MGYSDFVNLIEEMTTPRRPEEDDAVINFTEALAANPDREAQKVKIEQQTGTPAVLMDDDMLKQEQQAVSLKEFEAVPPGAKSFFAKRGNAMVAHDDIQTAIKLGKVFDSRNAMGLSTSQDRQFAATAKKNVRQYATLAGQELRAAVPAVNKGMAETVYNLDAILGRNAIENMLGIGGAQERRKQAISGWNEIAESKRAVKPATRTQQNFQNAAGSVFQSALSAPYALGGKTAALLSFAVNAPGQVEQYIQAGYSPVQSALFSLSNKAMEGLTELIGFKALFKGGSPVLRRAAEFAAGDVLGEEINTTYNFLMDKGLLQPDLSFDDYQQQLADTAISTAMAGGMQGALMQPFASLSEEFDRNRRAALNRDFMLALGEAAGESKLLQRLPEKYQEMVRAIKQDGDIDNVYIPGEQWQQYWQSKGIDPGAMADELMERGGEQVAEAVAVGGDVVIPVEVYAANLATSEHHAALLEHARLHPGDATPFESSTFESDLEHIVADFVQSAGAAVDTRPSYLNVFDDVLGQLVGIGYDQKTAEQYAGLAAIRARTRADRLGVDALELYNEAPLNIVRPLPEGVQRTSVDTGIDPLLDRLRAGDIPDDTTIFGPSLLQFVRERGVKDDRGDLKSMEVDAARKPGQRNIIRPDGMALDKLQEAAEEAGYLSGGTTTADLLDAIDRELRGNPVYSTQPIDNQMFDMRLALDELKMHLDQVGIDYNQLSNDQIRRELFQMQGGELFQSAWHGTPHTFDKFSTEHIGTGEGAQAYGYGLYFAGKKEVAEHYRDQLRDISRVLPENDAERIVLEQFEKAKKELEAIPALNDMKDWLSRDIDGVDAWTLQDAAEGLYKKAKGRLYHVELAPSEDEYLLWDKPLSEQSEKVKSALSDAGIMPGEKSKTGYLSSIENEEARSLAEDMLGREEERLFGETASRDWDTLYKLAPDVDHNLIHDIQEEIKEVGDGAMFYRDISDEEGTDKAASAYLHSLGIRGIKYLDGTSRNQKLEQKEAALRLAGKRLARAIERNDEAQTVIWQRKLAEAQADLDSMAYNYVIFSDDDVEIKEYFQRNAAKRGYFRFSDGTPYREIGLLKDADLSTFLHELSHSWLEELKADAARPDAPEQLKADWETIKTWLGSDGALSIEQHEQFARGGEAYLMEGKAPSADLLPVFQRFKSWLVSIYRSIKGLNVQLNDKVRGVFDRLLASEEEIQTARKANRLVELFATAEDAVMTETEFAAYRKEAAKAHAREVENLDRKLMQELQREHQQWWKDARAEVRATVEEEAQSSPVYRAIRLLSSGKFFDGTEGPVMKLDKSALVKMYGEPFLKRLPRGFGYIYANEGGVHPDAGADMFGFISGDEMIRQMIEAPKMDAFIEAETDLRMRSIYGDMRLDGTLADAAQEAIHNDLRGSVLAVELKAIRRKQREVAQVTNARDRADRQARNEADDAIPPREAFEMAAAQLIARKKIGDVAPRAYLEAERRAAKEAIQAAGKRDWQAAAKAKQQQLLNYYLYREALQLQEQVNEMLAYYKRIDKADKTLAKTRDVDMVNAARAILSKFGIGKKGLDAASYLNLIAQNNPDEYQDLSAAVDAATTFAKPYKQMTIDEMIGMDAAVRGLWELSRRSRQVEIDGKLLDKEQVVGELIASLENIGIGSKQPGKTKAITDFERFSADLTGIRAAATRVEAWVDALDMNKPGGVFRRFIWQPIADSVNAYRLERKRVIEKYLEAAKLIENEIVNSDIAAPELGYTFKGTGEILGAMLHTGNKSNMEKLLVGREWGFNAEDGGLDTTAWDRFIERMIAEGKITKNHYDFIQAVWDLMEEVKPRAQQAHKDIFGYYFSEIEVRPVYTPFGEYRGGYAPAISDSNMNPDQQTRQDREAMESNDNSYMFPTTGRGFTKARVQYNKPLILDLKLVPSHIDKALRFAYIEPRVKDVARILLDREFRDTMNQFNPAAISEMLVPWLQRAAQQTVAAHMKGRAGRAADIVFSELRRRTGMQMMVANVSNTLQQFTGLFLSAAKVKPRYLAGALLRYLHSPRVTASEISGRSDMMATRIMQSVYDTQQQAEEIILNPSRYQKMKDATTKHGYVLQQITQHIVDVVTWAGAYEQSIDEGESEAEAVKRADSAVRMTQGSFNPEDVSRIESGSALVRALTQFYTYFNMQANLLGSQAVGAVREQGSVIKAMPRLVELYALFAMTAIGSKLIEYSFKGGGGDDDDPVTEILLKSQLQTAFAMLPYGGTVINFAWNLADDKPYNDKMSVAPAFSMAEAIGKTAVYYPAQALRGDEINDRMMVRDTLNTIGFVMGLPVGPLGRPAGYLAGMAEGRYEPENGLDFARGLIQGTPKK